jgi:TM2 domain-containing membrane protein YozV
METIISKLKQIFREMWWMFWACPLIYSCLEDLKAARNQNYENPLITKILISCLLFFSVIYDWKSLFPFDILETKNQISTKERVVALILCFIFGGFGAHRFYVGKYYSALFLILASFMTGWHYVAASHYDYYWGKLDWVLLGFAVVLVLIDFILILIGKFTDREGFPLLKWTAKY